MLCDIVQLWLWRRQADIEEQSYYKDIAPNLSLGSSMYDQGEPGRDNNDFSSAFVFLRGGWKSYKKGYFLYASHVEWGNGTQLDTCRHRELRSSAETLPYLPCPQ